MATYAPHRQTTHVTLLAFLAFGMQIVSAASINNGAGNLLMEAGQISFGPNAKTNAGVISIHVGSFVMNGPGLISYSWGTHAGVTVSGTLTGSGDLTIQGAAVIGALNPFTLSFGNVANYTGNIVVEGSAQHPAIVTFGSAYEIDGTLQLKPF